MFVIYFLECIKGVDIIEMFVVYVVDKKIVIVVMVWSVGLELKGSERKSINMVFLFVFF